MTESVKIESMFFDENFSPNCRVNIRGEHFFTDKKLYSNLYGMGFFSDSDNIYNNPHISSACENLPGILDEYFTLDNLAQNIAATGNFEIRDAITQNFDKQFLAPPAKKRKLKSNIFCSFPARISRQNGEGLMLSYGTSLLTTLCITGGDTISAILPYSPFSNLTFFKGDRVYMTVDYLLPPEPQMPPEFITIDFAVTTKKMEIALGDDLTGKIELEYSIEVGVTKCEVSKVTFEIVRDDEHQSVE